MEVYFDNAATTRPIEDAILKAEYMSKSCFGNPSSMHRMGIEAEAEVNAATKRIAKLLNCKPDELCYTSGGTESDNTAIFGVANIHSKRGGHIITTLSEHPAVEQPVKFLEKNGYAVTRLRLDTKGHIDLGDLEQAVRKDTALVSIHHVNNETGTIQDISAAAGIVKKINPLTVFHSDGVQAFGKIDINLKNIDLYSISAHKLHAFKGTGALYIRQGLRLLPIVLGGGQNRGFRSGTENTVGIAAFGIAAEKCMENITDYHRYVTDLKNRLISAISQIPSAFINGDPEHDSPFILNVSFTGIPAEVLLNELDSEKIYVSAGAACKSRKRKTNLDNYGNGQERASSAIRFSFSRFNTEAEIDYCVSVLKRAITNLYI